MEGVSLKISERFIRISVKRDNRSVISTVDELSDRIGLKNLYKRLDAFIVLVSFLDSDDVNVGLCCG